MCRQMGILQGFFRSNPFFLGVSRKLPAEVTQDTPSMRGWNMLGHLESLKETNLYSRAPKKFGTLSVQSVACTTEMCRKV